MSVRVLWVSPLPPVRSGVSDYAVELLPELARRIAIRVVLPPGIEAAPIERSCPGCEVVPHPAQPMPGEVGLVHLGNNPYHEWLLPYLDNPGTVVVLHDLVLHHILVESTLSHGRFEEYKEGLEASHGARGRALAAARRFGVSGRRDPFLFPARHPFLTNAAGAIVHSSWARRQVLADLPDLPVAMLPMPSADPGESHDRADLRERLGIAPDELLLMHLGFLTREKGLDDILGAMAVLRDLGVPARLVLVGEGRGLESLRGAAESLGLGEAVTATGWVAAEDLLILPAAADLGVVLRKPSAGETSAAVLRFLACGTPVATIGLHQFLEWPQEAVFRVTPGPPAAADLIRAAAQRFQERESPTGLERRRRARLAYEDGHNPTDAARRLVSILEGVEV